MKVLMFVLNDSGLLQPLLNELDTIGVRGCTIFDSNGMGRELASKNEDVFNLIFGLRKMLAPDLKQNKTLMMVLDEKKIAVETVAASIEKIVGSLEEPDSGILFTLDADYVKGLKL